MGSFCGSLKQSKKRIVCYMIERVESMNKGSGLVSCIKTQLANRLTVA